MVGSDREARWIVEHVTRVLGLEGQVAMEAVGSLAGRRAAGEPLQYVLGRWPFRTVDLDVDPRVLIPRPETEQVVEVALDRLAASLRRPDRVEGPTICCDLGTGSGAIALSLAAEGPLGTAGLEVWATDRSSGALSVARANADRLARAGLVPSVRLELAEGSWFEALPPALRGCLDLVVSNPPYVSGTEFADLDPDRPVPRARLGARRRARQPGHAGNGRGRGDPARRPAMAAADRLGGGGDRPAPGRSRHCRRPVGRLRRRHRRGGPDRPTPHGDRRVLILDVGGDPPDPASIERAVLALRQGSVVAVPTDTVYGMAVDPWQPAAVARLFALKERPASVPVPVLVTGRAQLESLAGPLEPAAARLADRHWPGPLTLVVPRAASFVADLGGPASARATVGLRWPDHPVMAALCGTLGPLAVTSANRHGAPPATTAAEVGHQFTTLGEANAGGEGRPGLSVVLDGGRCSGTPSTVVECQGRSVRCLRQGALDFAALAAELEPPGQEGISHDEGGSG